MDMDLSTTFVKLSDQVYFTVLQVQTPVSIIGQPYIRGTTEMLASLLNTIGS